MFVIKRRTDHIFAYCNCWKLFWASGVGCAFSLEIKREKGITAGHDGDGRSQVAGN